jgi:hypothetical protein
MRPPRDFSEFRNQVQSVFDGNEQALEAAGITPEVQLKTYLVESSVDLESAVGGLGRPDSLGVPGWFSIRSDKVAQMLVLDASQPRVWRLFTLVPATASDDLVDAWVGATSGLDHCWLTRGQLMKWEREPGWVQRGIGLRFNDGLTPVDEAGNFSLKAWHGSRSLITGLNEVLDRARQSFAISSVRWQLARGGSPSLTAECYSDGKITLNRATDLDDVLAFSLEIANRYQESLELAQIARDTSLAPFEFAFSQKVNLDGFGEVVAMGKAPMRLWLTEVERDGDFRRYRGVDMHTWDRVFVDLTPEYGYLNVPSKGCVNAVPRIATIQGEDNAGRTTILLDGVEMFA